MKASDFLKHMTRIEAILKTAGGTEVANKLLSLLSIFDEQKSKQVSAVIKEVSNQKLQPSSSDPTINSVLPTLKELQLFIDATATAPLKKDISAFINFLESYKSCNIESFVLSVQSAQSELKQSQKAKLSKKRKTSKRIEKLEQSEIDRIIKLLKDTIGDADAFAKTYEELQIEDLTATDVAVIAKNIDSSTPKKPSKKVALQKIKARHQDLIKYSKTSKSMSGRSAA